MIRKLIARSLLVAVGAVGASLYIAWRAAPLPRPSDPAPVRAPLSATRVWGSAIENVKPDIERRLQRLEASVAEAAAEQHRLQEQLASFAVQFAARPGVEEAPPESSAPAGPAAAMPQRPASNAPPVPAPDDSRSSTLERGLAAAGIDAVMVGDIKRRQDESTMAEIYLRDQATREHWLDTPRFSEEMAAITAQRTPLREEIGDDAYDRYLAAVGEANRVRVEDVLLESPAANVGIQPGDLILRYGDSRVFAPDELVSATRGGTAGETVPVEILRDSQRLEVQVPRGPLGVRIAAIQAKPDAS